MNDSTTTPPLPEYDQIMDHLHQMGDRRSAGPDPYMALLMGRVESKLDAALTTLVRHETQLDQIEDRMDSLERHRAYTLGLVLAISVGITAIGALVDPKDFISIKPHEAPSVTIQPDSHGVSSDE